MARIKIGTPVVGDIREGEIEHRYITGTGLVLYTKYRNQLYSSKMYDSSVPPLIDKKLKSIIKKSSFINIDQFTGELELDFDALISASIANGDSILFIDSSSANAVRKESLADLTTLLAGNGLDAASSVLSVDVSDFMTNGANNYVITSVTADTMNAESNLQFNGSTLAVTGALTTTTTATIGTDLTITGGDIIYGNGQNATVSVTPTAHDVAGRLLTISAGNTTAGTTNNIAGGTLKLVAGQGKGSGAGGNIVFATANASGSGSSLNALATALTISDDLSSTFTGDVSVGDDLFLASSGSIVNWNSGDVTLTHAAGKLTFGGDGAVELDFNSHEMTNVDINSGAIDGTTIGAASQAAGDFTAIGAVAAGTIVGTTIDATTDFTIDGLVITADTITNDAALTVDAAGDIILDANSGVTKFYLAGDTDDLCTLTVAANGATTIATADSDGAVGHLTLDADGDIILDAAGDDIYFKDAGSERFRMDLDSTPTLAVTGGFTIDGSSTITLDSVTDFIVMTRDNQRIFVDDDGSIFLHAYAQNLNNNNYGINNKKDLYHFTTGNGDFMQNYTIISKYEVLETNEFEAYPS